MKTRLHILKYLLLFISIFLLFSVSLSKLPQEDQYGNVHTTNGTFWQFTDIHWDLRYDENGDQNQMCHINDTTKYNSSGYFGNYLCDAPWTLVQSAMVAMQKLQSKPDFILWTGDNAPHTNDPVPNFEVIFKTVSNLTEELRTRFADIPIIPVLGNHDAFPQNYYPAKNETFYEEYLEKSGWHNILSEKAREQFSIGGYFSARISSNLSILSINTNLYYKYNKLGTNSKDPAGQFAWMETKLDDIRKNNEKVLIAAHAPPGFWERNGREPFFNETYNDRYVNLLSKYGDIIIAQIYGHEHTDTFRIFNSNEETSSVAFLAPSLTPWFPTRLSGGTAINPSVRLYSYNSSNILDYNQYQLNLTEANEDKLINKVCLLGPTQNPASCKEELSNLWKLYYRAQIAFSVPIINVDGMTSFLGRLKSDDSLTQQYYLMNSAGVKHPDCNSTCKRIFLCAIDNLLIADFKSCIAGRDTVECQSSECFNGMGSHVLLAGIVATISLTAMLGIMLIIVMARRRKTILLGSTSTEFEWTKRHYGYRPLSGDVD